MAKNKEIINTQSVTYTLAQIDSVVEMIKKQMGNYSVFCFFGDLGAGKTTLIKKILASCGVTGVITSPTFTYVNIYKNAANQTFYHFDLYRITSIDEFSMLGFDQYLYQPNSFVFIEWPEIILPMLSHDMCSVAIEHGKNPDTRTIRIQKS